MQINVFLLHTLHQILIQWIDDKVEVVHGDNSACVVVANSHSISVHDDVKCLSGLDLSNYEFVSCSTMASFLLS
jgi:hypothetical protein